jgi:hypothetical protein
MLALRAQAFDFMVARGGIEPPTRGFSGRGPNRSNFLNSKAILPAFHGIFSGITPR